MVYAVDALLLWSFWSRGLPRQVGAVQLTAEQLADLVVVLPVRT